MVVERPGWSGAAFFSCFFAVGIPYWLIPYSQLGLPGALMGPGLLAVAFAALILRACGASTFWRGVAVAGAAVPAAVLARVVWEGVLDPTSHNLWPFEIVIALALGFLAALAGAIAGSLISMLTAGHTERGES